MRRASRIDWPAHLARFHEERPGITEDILAGSRDGDDDPYRWLLDGADTAGQTIDLACGSGPAQPLGAERWTGVDLSPAELRRARDAGRGPVVIADLARLPLPDGGADLAVCSMALMLVHPLDPALAEISRLLRPGGELRLLLPARRPLTVADRLLYARLFWALRGVTEFPRPRWAATRRRPSPLTACGSSATSAAASPSRWSTSPPPSASSTRGMSPPPRSSGSPPPAGAPVTWSVATSASRCAG